MKKFKDLEEYREYTRKKSKESYYRKMADPEKAAAYREKRREYDKKRYRDQMDELKNLES